jgi:hypothetical protein
MPEYYEPVSPDPGAQAEENKLVNTALSPLPVPYISGLKLNADIEINGLTLNTIDGNNVIWVVSDIDGWWTLPEPELPDLPRGWGDGSYDAIGRWANRIITLNGSFLPQSPEDAPAARTALINAVNLVKTGGWLKVNEDSYVRASYVRLSGAPIITSVNARGRHDFSIAFKAVDPIKYEYVDGADDGYNFVEIPNGSISGAGSVPTITNYGNTPVPVVFAITGGLYSDTEDSAFIVNNTTTKTITLVGTTTASQALEVDTKNREILLVTDPGQPSETVENGRAKAAVLVDWIYLNPGVNEIEYYDSGNVSSSSICTVYWRSGWVG